MSNPIPTVPANETIVPNDQSALADAIRRAAASDLAVYPTGGRTSLTCGVWPSLPGMELSLTRLNRVIDHQAKDLTVTVEAGVTMADLRKRLAAHRQRLPIDVPAMDRATVGGVVATCPAGPRQFHSGSMRDYVIGLTAVDGNGEPFSAGGRVVKNAAGYDLCRLLTGSLGTLGVVTQMTLMVKPMPETSAMVASEVADLDDAEQILSQLVNTPTSPTAVELLVGPAWENDSTLGPVSASALGRLVVAFEGDRADVDWMVGQLADDWQSASGAPTKVTHRKRIDAQWKRLTEFAGESFADLPPDVVVQANVLPAHVTDCVRLVLDIDPKCSIQAHACDGVVVVRFTLPPEHLADSLTGRLRPHVTNAGGSVAVLSYPENCRWDRETIWGPAPAAMKVMWPIKNQFDPKGILNRERYVF